MLLDVLVPTYMYAFMCLDTLVNQSTMGQQSRPCRGAGLSHAIRLIGV